MFGLGIGEIALILFIALIFIGPKKLPELARGLGKGMREFQNAAKGLQEHIQRPVDEVKKEVATLTKLEEEGEQDLAAANSSETQSSSAPISRKS